MKGLIRKDLLLLAKALKAFLLFAVVFGVISLSQSNSEEVSSALGGYFFTMIVLIQIFTLSADEQARWLRMEKALPITPYQAVLSKYLMSLLGIVIGMVLFIAFCLRDILKTGNFLEPLDIAAGLIGAALLLSAIEFPLSYRFGSNSGRFLFFGLAIVVVGLVWAAQTVGLPLENIVNWLVQNQNLLIALGVSIPVLAIVGSYFLSVHIYRQKEW